MDVYKLSTSKHVGKREEEREKKVSLHKQTRRKERRGEREESVATHSESR
jgi:hypothetical protein